MHRLYKNIFGIEDFKHWLWFVCCFGFFQNWLDSSKEIKRQIRSKYFCIQMLCFFYFLSEIFSINLVVWMLIAYSFKIISDRDVFSLKTESKSSVSVTSPSRGERVTQHNAVEVNHYIILEANQIYYCPKIFPCCVWLIADIFASWHSRRFSTLCWYLGYWMENVVMWRWSWLLP